MFDAAHRTCLATVKKMLEHPAARTEIEVEAAEQIFKIDATEQILAAETGYGFEPTGVIFGPLLRMESTA